MKVATQEEFWSLNRAAISTRTISEWKERETSVLAHISWMNNGWDVPPHDPDYFPFEDGVADIEAHIAAYGTIHDDAYAHPLLQDFRPFWGVWSHEANYIDSIWGLVQPYWRDTERFQALCAESEATKVFAKFGIRTALPAYDVRLWRQQIDEHRKLAASGKTHDVSEKDLGVPCWLCNFERLHGTQP